MTTQQARGGDPYLTQIAQNAILQEFVGNNLFPSAYVSVRGATRIEIEGHEHVLYETGRAPGASIVRVNYDFQENSFQLENHALSESVPVEMVDEHSHVPGDALKASAATRAMRKLGLRVEYQQAQKALNPANYGTDNKRTLSGSGQWTHEDSTPTLDIETGRNAIRAKKGFYPNVALLSAPTFSAIRFHPAFQGRDPITPEYLAALWDLEKVVVGKATYKKPEGGYVDIWGRNVVLAYSPEREQPDLLEPCFGYTYHYEGCPYVNDGSYDRNNRNWIYTATDEFVVELVMGDAGYLLQEVVPSA